jgi:phage repressor protein C with HTH and peptisase S24 domain
MIISTDPVDWVLRPDPLRNVSAGYGVIIIGESMIPEFRPGDIALINPHLPAMRQETFIFYREAEGETKSTIKHLLRWTDAAWHVAQWNPPKGQKSEFTLPRKEWSKIHRVVGRYVR